MNRRIATVFAALVLAAGTLGGAATVSPAYAADLKCGDWPGDFGSERATDGSEFLIGEAQEKTLYNCKSPGDEPTVKMRCNKVIFGKEEGMDFCGR
ncbi:hypothetical protein [Streptomyces sp. NPDC002602]|uniref:hypothetical protein n=1 Tax=Streptomyces sp. NPDC002602 TaxID=3364654 RepID=UPI0036A532C7